MSRLLHDFAGLSDSSQRLPEGPLLRDTRIAEQAARAGGRVLLSMIGRIRVRNKGPKDQVTEADETSQRVIREILLGACPNYAFLGEEDASVPAGTCQGLADSGSAPLRWVVDPLDGTANYVKGLPGFAVSIGLERAGAIQAGVVYDPTLDECFVAASGFGASLNGRPLRVSACEQLAGAMVAASFPPNIGRTSPEIPRFESMLVSCLSLRRLGSAALNLCYLAAGRLDAYWSTTCQPWDVAAGVLMVEEAGGIVSDLAGGEFDLSRPVFAASANMHLHRQFLQALHVAEPPAS